MKTEKTNFPKELKLADSTPVYKNNKRHDRKLQTYKHFSHFASAFMTKFTKMLLRYYQNTKQAIGKVAVYNIH